MKYFLILIPFLIGCETRMTNSQIIAETKVCEEYGLVAVPTYVVFGSGISDITCAPEWRKNRDSK